MLLTSVNNTVLLAVKTLLNMHTDTHAEAKKLDLVPIRDVRRKRLKSAQIFRQILSIIFLRMSG